MFYLQIKYFICTRKISFISKSKNVSLEIDDWGDEYVCKSFDGEENVSNFSSSQIEIDGCVEDEHTSDLKKFPICCKDQTIIPLMKNCAHEPACQQSLREMSVKKSQEIA